MIDKTLPKEIQTFLKNGGRLEIIRLDKMGKWTHEGLSFENKKIIALFHRSVEKSEGGSWLLHIGRFYYPIEVERCGYFVNKITKKKNNILLHTTRGQEILNPSSLSFENENELYCKLSDGFEARFIGSAYLDFAELIEEKKGTFFFKRYKI